MITMINSFQGTLILLTLITLSLTVKKTPTLFIRSHKFLYRRLQFAIGASLHRCYGLGPGGSSSLTTDALSSLSGHSSADPGRGIPQLMLKFAVGTLTRSRISFHAGRHQVQNLPLR